MDTWLCPNGVRLREVPLYPIQGSLQQQCEFNSCAKQASLKARYWQRLLQFGVVVIRVMNSINAAHEHYVNTKQISWQAGALATGARPNILKVAYC